MGYRKLFWGFIFLLDFRICGWDVLPDVIAYVLFFLGLSKLAYDNENFDKGKFLAIPLMIISLFDIYQRPAEVSGIVHTGGTIWFGIGIIAMVLNLIMVYRICMGIHEGARRKGDFDLSEKATNRWKYYLGVNIGTLILIIIPSIIVFFVVGIASVVNVILMLSLMSLAGKSLEV